MHSEANVRISTHYHIAGSPEDIPSEYLQDFLGDRAMILRKNMAGTDISGSSKPKIVVLEDYSGHGNRYGYFLNAIVDNPKLMGEDCDIVANTEFSPNEDNVVSYMAVYFGGKHAFDIISMVEANTDLGDVLFYAPKRRVLNRIDIDGKHTSRVYDRDGIENIPRFFQEVVGDYGDSGAVILPHASHWKHGVLRSENLNDSKLIESIDGIVYGISKNDFGFEIFNAARSRDPLYRGWRAFERRYGYNVSNSGTIGGTKGVVGDDGYFEDIGFNQMVLWMEDYGGDLNPRDAAWIDLENRMSTVFKALKTGEFDVGTKIMIPWEQFIGRTYNSLMWQAKKMSTGMRLRHPGLGIVSSERNL